MKKAKSGIRRKLKIAFVIFLLFYLGFIYIEQDAWLSDQADQKEQLMQGIEAADNQNEEIIRMIDYTYTEEFIERAARHFFGWVREGEIKFIEKEEESR